MRSRSTSFLTIAVGIWLCASNVHAQVHLGTANPGAGRGGLVRPSQAESLQSRLEALESQVRTLQDRREANAALRRLPPVSTTSWQVHPASYQTIDHEASENGETETGGQGADDPEAQPEVAPAAFFFNRIFQPAAPGGMGGVTPREFEVPLSRPERIDIGVDLYSAPEFEGGLIIYGPDVAMKIGGYVKADFIQDFNPIDSTDSFVTTTIPVGAPPRTNSRFHARQTRLSFDTRWASQARPIRIYVEGDFFSEGDRFRLRHAYGEVGSLQVGRTWTTFTDVAAAPATLDFEGSVSSINRRQSLARWTQPILHDDLTVALAVEDTRFIIEAPVGISGNARSPSPDFVGHVRLDREWGKFQIAGLYRIVGFQPTGGDVITAPAWGFNFTGVVLVTPVTKGYYQIVFGEGIGSYRDLPDAAPSGVDRSTLLPLFGWMVGVTHEWNDWLSSNFTYAENQLDNAPLQLSRDVHKTTYLAANLIWNPLDRVKLGVEYLYGIRQNVDGAQGQANRLQVSFIFDLP